MIPASSCFTSRPKTDGWVLVAGCCLWLPSDILIVVGRHPCVGLDAKSWSYHRKSLRCGPRCGCLSKLWANTDSILALELHPESLIFISFFINNFYLNSNTKCFQNSSSQQHLQHIHHLVSNISTARLHALRLSGSAVAFQEAPLFGLPRIFLVEIKDLNHPNSIFGPEKTNCIRFGLTIFFGLKWKQVVLTPTGASACFVGNDVTCHFRNKPK